MIGIKTEDTFYTGAKNVGGQNFWLFWMETHSTKYVEKAILPGLNVESACRAVQLPGSAFEDTSLKLVTNVQ